MNLGRAGILSFRHVIRYLCISQPTLMLYLSACLEGSGSRLIPYQNANRNLFYRLLYGLRPKSRHDWTKMSGSGLEGTELNRNYSNLIRDAASVLVEQSSSLARPQVFMRSQQASSVSSATKQAHGDSATKREGFTKAS